MGLIKNAIFVFDFLILYVNRIVVWKRLLLAISFLEMDFVFSKKMFCLPI